RCVFCPRNSTGTRAPAISMPRRARTSSTASSAAAAPTCARATFRSCVTTATPRPVSPPRSAVARAQIAQGPASSRAMSVSNASGTSRRRSPRRRTIAAPTSRPPWRAPARGGGRATGTAMTDAFPATSPHRHAGTSVQGIMLRVVAALVPGMALYAFFFGIAILVQCFIAVACALAVEAAMLALRGRPVRTFLFDGSAVVTGLLFALSASPFLPWWVTVTGTAFAVAVAKHAFGGLGANPFNPAMAGYVFVLLCFPVEMSAWPPAPGAGAAPGAAESIGLIFGTASVDAYSGATALERLQT